MEKLNKLIYSQDALKTENISNCHKNKKEDILKTQVKLRRFPFPFRAALAICSDIDNCDRRTFVDVHRFLNTQRSGLGLPISDSFFAVSPDPRQIAYFRPDGKTHSDDANLIRRGVKDGLIDSLHSWGDFNIKPPEPAFLRDVAERITNEFSDLGLELKIWINHGSPNNRQNIKSRLKSEYKGDDPESLYYTSDLFRDLGIKFYWWSEIVPWSLSTQFKALSAKLWVRGGVNGLKNVVKLLSGRQNQIRTFSNLTDLGQPIVLRDGTRLIGFTRFNFDPQGLWTLPTRHTLRYSLNPKILNELVRKEGYLIIYTHLGLPRWQAAECDELFPNPDKKALDRLANLFHDGKIWVAPTNQLLSYWFLTRYLEWQVSQVGDRTAINLLSINDPTDGHRPPQKDELSGLCFYTHNPEKTIIRLGAEELPVRVHSMDHTGIRSIGVALAPLPAPKTDIIEE